MNPKHFIRGLRLAATTALVCAFVPANAGVILDGDTIDELFLGEFQLVGPR